jgi:hypothetical protein
MKIVFLHSHMYWLFYSGVILLAIAIIYIILRFPIDYCSREHQQNTKDKYPHTGLHIFIYIRYIGKVLGYLNPLKRIKQGDDKSKCEQNHTEDFPNCSHTIPMHRGLCNRIIRRLTKGVNRNRGVPRY